MRDVWLQIIIGKKLPAPKHVACSLLIDLVSPLVGDLTGQMLQTGRALVVPSLKLAVLQHQALPWSCWVLVVQQHTQHKSDGVPQIDNGMLGSDQAHDSLLKQSKNLLKDPLGYVQSWETHLLLTVSNGCLYYCLKLTCKIGILKKRLRNTIIEMFCPLHICSSR